MIWDPDYSWMEDVTVKAPVPYSVRRRQRRLNGIFGALAIIFTICGALLALR